MKTNKEIRHDNLIALIDEAGSIQAVADAVKKSHSQISQLKNRSINTGTGKERGIGDEMARELELAFSKPRGWMDVIHEGSNVAPAAIGAQPIPVISYVQAGTWTEAVDPYAMGDGHRQVYTAQRLGPSAFALEIKGDSMLPRFQPGHVVIIDPDTSPEAGDFVVAKNGKGEATFKKYRPRGVNEFGEVIFELTPLNEDYETLYSDREPIRIIGTMVEHQQYRKR